MKYLIIAFKSRNSTLSFNQFLKSKGIIGSIINTPSSIGSSCTLSIQLDIRFLNTLTSLISTFKNDLTGVYLLRKIGLHEQTERLY